MNDSYTFRRWVASASLVCQLAVFTGFQQSTAAADHFTDAEAMAAKVFLRNSFSSGNSGMVIGLLDENGPKVFGAGKLDNGTDQEVNGDTLFEIGSVTKVFTALLALEMEQKGEIHLDDPVVNYLPANVTVPSHGGKKITLLNLAAQESGLPWHPDNLTVRASKDFSVQEVKRGSDAYDVADLYTFLSSHTLTSDPGSRFQYSNVGMALLGHVMERKTGDTYEALIINRISRPLQMGSTRIRLNSEEKLRFATGHTVDGKPSENVNFKIMAASGSIISSVNDLLKFLSASIGLTPSHLSPLMERMQRSRHVGDPRFGKTAMPWLDDRVYQPAGSELWGHGGGGFGYLAFIGFDKTRRRAVAVLSNQLVWNPSGVGWAILQGMPLSRENVSYFVREVVGVGTAIESDVKSGLIRITTVFPKSAAGQAGLSVGQLIQSIDGISVLGKSALECLKLLGGPAESKVRLEIVNPASLKTNSVELTRKKFVTTTG